ncbi:MAG: arginine--tRNA ligase, partial [Nanoarchaeota archaeon]
MKERIIESLKITGLDNKTIEELIEIPKDLTHGDYSFPCFILSKTMRKSPNHIAEELAKKINKKGFEKIEAIGPYINFF